MRFRFWKLIITFDHLRLTKTNHPLFRFIGGTFEEANLSRFCIIYSSITPIATITIATREQNYLRGKVIALYFAVFVQIFLRTWRINNDLLLSSHVTRENNPTIFHLCLFTQHTKFEF